MDFFRLTFWSIAFCMYAWKGEISGGRSSGRFVCYMYVCTDGWHYPVVSKVFWSCWASSGSLISFPRELLGRFVAYWEIFMYSGFEG